MSAGPQIRTGLARDPPKKVFEGRYTSTKIWDGLTTWRPTAVAS